MLKIGFDAKRLFNNTTGLGNYSRKLVLDLNTHFAENAYYLFSPSINPSPENHSFLSEPFKKIAPGFIPGPLWRSFFMKQDITRASLDIFHGLSNELPWGIEKIGVPSIVTIHDLIFREYPEDYPPIDRLVYDIKFRHACKKATRIIADSESTKRDIIRHYHTDEKKISVVYLPCDDRFLKTTDDHTVQTVTARYRLPKKYLLYVGTINKRKNLLTLVKAMLHVKQHCALPLVVVGNGKGYKTKIQAYIAENNLQSSVLFAPHIANDDLPAVYRGAACFIFPSRYEGFGLPIVEALYSGVPVITTRLSSLPEIAGKGAWYADPDRPETIAEGIVKIITSPDFAKDLIREGYKQVLQFNSKTIATSLMAIYKETIAEFRAGKK